MQETRQMQTPGVAKTGEAKAIGGLERRDMQIKNQSRESQNSESSSYLNTAIKIRVEPARTNMAARQVVWQPALLLIYIQTTPRRLYHTPAQRVCY